MDIRRIDGPAGAWKPGGEPTPRKPAASSKSGARDRVEIGSGSSESRNPAGGVSRVAAASADIREERVEAVRENVDSGYYNQPESIEKVANKMVDKGFVG